MQCILVRALFSPFSSKIFNAFRTILGVRTWEASTSPSASDPPRWWELSWNILKNVACVIFRPQSGQVTLKIFGKTHCRKGRIQVYFQSGAAEIADWECLTHHMTSRENSSKQWQEDTRPWLPASDETCPTCNKTSKACRHGKHAFCVARLIVIAILHYDILIVKFMIWRNMMPYNDNDV